MNARSTPSNAHFDPPGIEFLNLDLDQRCLLTERDATVARKIRELPADPPLDVNQYCSHCPHESGLVKGGGGRGAGRGAGRGGGASAASNKFIFDGTNAAPGQMEASAYANGLMQIYRGNGCMEMRRGRAAMISGCDSIISRRPSRENGAGVEVGASGHLAAKCGQSDVTGPWNDALDNRSTLE